MGDIMYQDRIMLTVKDIYDKEFKLDNGKVVSLEEAIDMCKNGDLPDYNVGTSKSGTNYLRGNADGDESNNLDSMQTF